MSSANIVNQIIKNPDNTTRDYSGYLNGHSTGYLPESYTNTAISPSGKIHQPLTDYDRLKEKFMSHRSSCGIVLKNGFVDQSGKFQSNDHIKREIDLIAEILSDVTNPKYQAYLIKHYKRIIGNGPVTTYSQKVKVLNQLKQRYNRLIAITMPTINYDFNEIFDKTREEHVDVFVGSQFSEFVKIVRMMLVERIPCNLCIHGDNAYFILSLLKEILNYSLRLSTVGNPTQLFIKEQETSMSKYNLCLRHNEKHEQIKINSLLNQTRSTSNAPVTAAIISGYNIIADSHSSYFVHFHDIFGAKLSKTADKTKFAEYLVYCVLSKNNN